MKLEQENIAFIQSVVKTAQLVGIDNIIIEPGLVRAIDDDKTVVLFQDVNIPEMPFGSIGLNRIGIFTARYDIARSQDNFTIDAIVRDEEFALSLTMKGKGVRIDYRCANPTTINAPRQINDVLQNRVHINAETVLLLQKGQAAMGSEQVTINSSGNGVSFEIIDINNDVFKHTFTADVENLVSGTTTLFAHRYPIKTLLALFKQDPDGYFDVGQKGILRIPVNGLDLFVLPQV